MRARPAPNGPNYRRDELLVRLPSAPGYVPQVDKEHRRLPVLAAGLPLPIPVPAQRGRLDGPSLPVVGVPVAAGESAQDGGVEEVMLGTDERRFVAR